jgi:hypothetical protein
MQRQAANFGIRKEDQMSSSIGAQADPKESM